MAKSVNKVILIGNLGKDPEVKYTQTGMAVARFSVATNDRFKDKDGNWQDRTEWHNLVAFQRTAEIAAEYLKKGARSISKAVCTATPGTTRRLARRSTRPRSSSTIWCCSADAMPAARGRRTSRRQVQRHGPAHPRAGTFAGAIRRRDHGRRYSVLMARASSWNCHYERSEESAVVCGWTKLGITADPSRLKAVRDDKARNADVAH